MSELLKAHLPGPGTLALVGSGEYLPPIEPLDRWLLARLKEPPKVVCLPTAAGTEGDERIAYWSDLGVEHFRQLGVEAQAVRVIDRASASRPNLVEKVQAANFIYLSGGKPAYLYGSLFGTPVWDAIQAVLKRGGVVAGCSAGAMIFGERIPTSLFATNWQPAFGLLPGAFIIPHFDEIPRMMLQGMRLVAGKLVVVGIDGSTGLICDSEGLSVRGKGRVVILQDGKETVYSEGKIGS
jgi:cyanophycinase